MYTTLKLNNKDGTKRVITVMGNYTYEMAVKLAKDIEQENYKNVLIYK